MINCILKKIHSLILIISLCLLTSACDNGISKETYAENFFNTEWWKTATVNDIKQAVKKGVNINAKGNQGITPLAIASSFNQNPEVIEALIKNGADINAKLNSGDGILIAALLNPNPKIIEIILKNGTNINDRTGDLNWNALFYACTTCSDPEKIKILIKYGANINDRDKYGFTPLMVAASKCDDPKLFKFLIQNGADVNAKADDGNTALNIATYYNKYQAIKTLKENGAN